MTNSDRIQALRVKPFGRVHLACLRCRSQKVKCSGTTPKCMNCITSNHECKYPKRDKKVTLFQSQLDQLQDRIKFLEERVAKPEPCSKITTMSGNAPIEEINIPFNSKLSTSANTSYFGISSGQVFNSELKSHLFEINGDEDRKTSSLGSEHGTSRHYFKDPTLENSFSGVVMLPDKDYALTLVDKVIRFLGREFYLYDAKEFYKQIDEAYEKLKDKKPLWICYFLMTLAVGEQYSTNHSNFQTPGIHFYLAAMRLYRPSYEEPTVEFVQTLLLIAFYLQGLNSVNAAFSFYGLAMRSALTQGLHRNFPSLERREAEKRKRLWWTVFIMDNIWSSNLGHPIHVQIEDVDVDYPSENFVDLDDDFNIELLGYNFKLATILGFVMKNVYCPVKGSTSINVKKVLECVKQLDRLKNILPVNIKNNLILSENRSTANLYLRLNHYIIVTTRPLLLSLFKGEAHPTAEIKRVISRCVDAAIMNIDILSSLQSNGWLSVFGFWDAQYCFSSLIILTICTFAGNIYSHTNTAREINKFMKDTGNFTAIDNESKLLELDELLSKLPDYRKSDTSTNESNVSIINGKAAPDSIDGQKNISLEENVYTPENTTASATPITTGANISPIKDRSMSANPDPTFKWDVDQMKFTEFLSEIGKTFSAPIGDFTPFRNNVSPDTWHELTTNLQFWDFANQ